MDSIEDSEIKRSYWARGIMNVSIVEIKRCGRTTGFAAFVEENLHPAGNAGCMAAQLVDMLACAFDPRNTHEQYIRPH